MAEADGSLAGSRQAGGRRCLTWQPRMQASKAAALLAAEAGRPADATSGAAKMRARAPPAERIWALKNVARTLALDRPALPRARAMLEESVRLKQQLVGVSDHPGAALTAAASALCATTACRLLCTTALAALLALATASRSMACYLQRQLRTPGSSAAGWPRQLRQGGAVAAALLPEWQALLQVLRLEPAWAPQEQDLGSRTLQAFVEVAERYARCSAPPPSPHSRAGAEAVLWPSLMHLSAGLACSC